MTDMLRDLILILLAASILAACENVEQINSEQDYIEKYLAANDITAQPMPSGLYYIETYSNKAPKVEKGKPVKVYYAAYYIQQTGSGNPIFFHAADTLPFEFTPGSGQVIRGLDEGVSYMQEGERATLIIPSSLGYGKERAYNIPAYSTLVFDVVVVSDDPYVWGESLWNQYVDINELRNFLRPEGFYYKSLFEGAGTPPADNEPVSIYFRSWLLDETLWYADTIDPFEFTVGQTAVISAFHHAVRLMNRGGIGYFAIPSSLIEQGKSPAVFPAYNPFLFEIELLSDDAAVMEPTWLYKYLLANKISTLPDTSGLYFISKGAGTGPQPTDNDKVEISYLRSRIEGGIAVKVDSATTDNPAVIDLASPEVPRGLTLGLLKMKEGGRAMLIFGSELGYGAGGSEDIPPYSSLIYEVTLEKVNP